MSAMAFVFLFGGSLALIALRPWRFLAAQTHCPQCQNPLPRWGVWGWNEEWTCGRCGCHVEEGRSPG